MEPLFYPKGDRIFITGATGLLGAQFIRKLLGQGYRVVALRRKEVVDPWLKEVDDQIEWRLGDINDVQSLLEGMKGCQHVI
ncbi:MAG: NAD-dependent epimerase/dehydratase family protein, partial [Bacteroidota bacterium]|nr:NAD-dependent epimerase/dehydratase family protein [Bacteroidota bacterium]